MNHILKIFCIAVAMVTAIPSFAVTDKEMEAARTVAAKHYLRYANNGSDYLDKLNPTTMAELGKDLKAKEKENLKSFNAVSVPKDYASWDKAKLVEYWSSTFFKSPGLKEDGKKCLSILAKNLNKINVGAPAPKEEKAPVAPAETPAEVKETPAAAAQEAPTAVEPAATPAPEPTDEEATVLAQAEADSGVLEDRPQQKSNTGWYIAILIALVGVVVWLVMYASKSMKETGAVAAGSKSDENEVRDLRRAAKEEQNKMREQYASSLSAKNEEIKQLKSQCAALEARLESITAKHEDMVKQLEVARQQLSSRSAGNVREAHAPAPKTNPAPAAQSAAAPAPKGAGLPPVVFLGYVNQRGLFVKASRSLNTESSVYRMDIPDGHHGVFRVADDAEILDRLLSDPKLWLEGGCLIENPEDADIATEIVTLEAGEALFADNCCRVTKKARIKFI